MLYILYWKNKQKWKWKWMSCMHNCLWNNSATRIERLKKCLFGCLRSSREWWQTRAVASIVWNQEDTSSSCRPSGFWVFLAIRMRTHTDTHQTNMHWAIYQLLFLNSFKMWLWNLLFDQTKHMPESQIGREISVDHELITARDQFANWLDEAIRVSSRLIRTQSTIASVFHNNC